MALKPGERTEIPASIVPSTRLSAGEYIANVVLCEHGAERDRISYPFRVIKPEPPTPSETVKALGGDFYLGERRWHPVGMNYYPRSCIGMDDFQTWVHWMSPTQYNPYVVEEDLAKMQSLGINMVSTTSLAEDESPALMDFLARAWNHGIRVNLYLPGLHPLYHYPEWARKLILGAHLADSKALFAYDLGVEVHVGPYADRKQFDSRWQSWVIDRYGSVETAEKDWGFTPESVDGTLSGPKDDQLTTDGEWRRYIAAYRRFWDDEISKGYRTVRRFILDLDPHHLIGAKSGWAGTGAMAAVTGFAFDLASGAKHLDFTSPEAYGINGDRGAFTRGGINTAYGRFVSGGKPVFWCEFGPPVGTSLRPDRYAGYTPGMLDAQREYYRNVTSMVCESGANGLAGWWWPAGYRIDENSDYGVMNQDLTPRLSAQEFPAITRTIGQLGPPRRPTTAITIDRDRFVTGYAGIYAESSGKCAEAVSKGQVPGLRTDGTGTTSANTPLVAVGNTPCNGHNPPKYLNAEFNWVKVDGKLVQNGTPVEVEKGKPVHIEASVGNIAEAKWLAPKGGEDGSIYLVSIADDNRLLVPISCDTPFLGDASVNEFTVVDGVIAETSIVLKMTAKGRTDFGEVFRVTLKPR